MALVCDVYCDFVTFPFGILGQMLYLIVSIPYPCCLSYFVFLVSPDCCVVIPRGAMGLSAVCDCGFTLSYSFTIFIASQYNCMKTTFINAFCESIAHA